MLLWIDQQHKAQTTALQVRPARRSMDSRRQTFLNPALGRSITFRLFPYQVPSPLYFPCSPSLHFTRHNFQQWVNGKTKGQLGTTFGNPFESATHYKIFSLKGYFLWCELDSLSHTCAFLVNRVFGWSWCLLDNSFPLSSSLSMESLIQVFNVFWGTM